MNALQNDRVFCLFCMNGTGRRTCHLLLKVRGAPRPDRQYDWRAHFLISSGELIIMAHNGLINPDIYSMTLSAVVAVSLFRILPFIDYAAYRELCKIEKGISSRRFVIPKPSGERWQSLRVWLKVERVSKLLKVWHGDVKAPADWLSTFIKTASLTSLKLHFRCPWRCKPEFHTPVARSHVR